MSRWAVRGRLERARTRLPSGPGGLVCLALTVGAGAGTGAVLFRYLILWFTEAFTGRHDYSSSGRTPYGYLPALGPWFVVAAPVLGGLVYGPLVQFFAREARGHGVPEVMVAVAERGGRIRPQVAVVKSLASAVCIGSGGSVGREGPIVQIGSALGSTLGQLARVGESRLRVLVACGAAGGISATFNAPIAGVFFALELILRDVEAEAIGVVVLSSFVADLIGRAAFGSHPFLTLPAFVVRSPVEYPLYLGLGLAAALVGVVFIRVLYGSEDLADRIWRGPEWLRPAAGGVLLGLLLLALPEMYGVGYPPLEKAIRGDDVVWFMLLLLAAKIAATSLTLAIGGSGGVFAPSLFMGAMLGSVYGAGVHQLFPGLTAPAGAYGLVGMGAVFAAAARAPITAVIIIFELTGDYSIVLPLMLAISLATALSGLLSRDTIYTLKLRRRGIDIMRGRGANLMQLLTVEQAMRPLPPLVAGSTPLEELVGLLGESGGEGLPVADADGAYAGVVSSREIEQALLDSHLDATAAELAAPAPTLAADQTLEDALGALLRADSGLPVVADDAATPCGWLTQTDVLRAYDARLRQRLERAAGAASPPAMKESWARLRGSRLVRLGLGAGSDLVGKHLEELDWPERTNVVALGRGGRTFEPARDETLAQDDVLALLVPASEADGLAEAVSGPGQDGVEETSRQGVRATDSEEGSRPASEGP